MRLDFGPLAIWTDNGPVTCGDAMACFHAPDEEVGLEVAVQVTRTFGVVIIWGRKPAKEAR